jgi:hypothetical protein
MRIQRINIAASEHAPAHVRWQFTCPGCNDTHHFQTGHPEGPNWAFNGDVEKPTFAPSLLVRTGHFTNSHKEGDHCWCTYEKDYGEKPPFDCYRCHSFVTDGKIQFLGDCTHRLAGRTVDLPDIPENARP